MKDTPLTKLKDGRWVPAQPIPYYRDTRPVIVKLWHCLLALRGVFVRGAEKQEAYFDRLDKRMDEWMVPVEPYTDENGVWRSW